MPTRYAYGTTRVKRDVRDVSASRDGDRAPWRQRRSGTCAVELRADLRGRAVGRDAADDRGDDVHRPDLVRGRVGDVAVEHRDVTKRAAVQVTATGIVTQRPSRIE